MAGKHSEHPWRDLGVLRGTVAAAAWTFGGAVRFSRQAPEWLVGLVVTAVGVVVFLFLAG